MIMHIPKSTYYHKWFIGATLVVPVLPLAAQTSPNLVFIMADQYRGDALGCLGKEPVKTPCLVIWLPKESYSLMQSAVILFHHPPVPC